MSPKASTAFFVAAILASIVWLFVGGCTETEKPGSLRAGFSTNQSEQQDEEEDGPSERPLRRKPSSVLDQRPTVREIGDYAFAQAHHPYREGEVIKGVLFGDHRVEVGGAVYTFAGNTEIEFYNEEGDVRLASLKANKTLSVDSVDYNLRGGYQTQRGKSEVEFYPSGSVKRAGLSSSPTMVLAGQEYNIRSGYASQADPFDISFTEDGKVRSVFFAKDSLVSMDGVEYKFKSNSETIFHDNGLIGSGLVVFEVGVGGIGQKFAITVRLAFDEDGSLSEENSPPTYPNGRWRDIHLLEAKELHLGGIRFPLAAGLVELYDTGAIKSAFLARRITARIGGHPYALNAGSRVVFHGNGAVKEVDVASIDMAINGHTFKLRGGRTTFSDDGEWLHSSDIQRHPNGMVFEAFLLERTFLGHLVLQEGEIGFHDDGSLRIAVLDQGYSHRVNSFYVGNLRVPEIIYTVKKGLVGFHPNGKRASGEVSQISIKNRAYPVSSPVWFDQSGTLLLLPFPTYESGGIKSLVLSEDVRVRLGGSDYVIAGGSRVHFHENGEISTATMVGSPFRAVAAGRDVTVFRVFINNEYIQAYFYFTPDVPLEFHTSGVLKKAHIHVLLPSTVLVKASRFVLSGEIEFRSSGALRRAYSAVPSSIWASGNEIIAEPGFFTFNVSGYLEYFLTPWPSPQPFQDADGNTWMIAPYSFVNLYKGKVSSLTLEDFREIRFNQQGRPID